MVAVTRNDCAFKGKCVPCYGAHTLREVETDADLGALGYRKVYGSLRIGAPAEMIAELRPPNVTVRMEAG
jgi:hypothetical protein